MRSYRAIRFFKKKQIKNKKTRSVKQNSKKVRRYAFLEDHSYHLGMEDHSCHFRESRSLSRPLALALALSFACVCVCVSGSV